MLLLNQDAFSGGCAGGIRVNAKAFPGPRIPASMSNVMSDQCTLYAIMVNYRYNILFVLAVVFTRWSSCPERCKQPNHTYVSLVCLNRKTTNEVQFSVTTLFSLVLKCSFDVEAVFRTTLLSGKARHPCLALNTLWWSVICFETLYSYSLVLD